MSSSICGIEVYDNVMLNEKILEFNCSDKIKTYYKNKTLFRVQRIYSCDLFIRCIDNPEIEFYVYSQCVVKICKDNESGIYENMCLLHSNTCIINHISKLKRKYREKPTQFLKEQIIGFANVVNNRCGTERCKIPQYLYKN